MAGATMVGMDSVDKHLLRLSAISPGILAYDEGNKARLDHLVELGLVKMVRMDILGAPLKDLYCITPAGQKLLD